MATRTESKLSSTARDMIEMLRRHYLSEGRPAAGIFAPEIAAPTGTRRADRIFQGCTAAAGAELIGHEIKVSRADLLAELDDLTKSDPWQRYCDRWWLVIPHPSLIDGVALPHTWGVLTPPSGRRTRSMTVHRPAPKLTPADQAPALRTLATWLHWRHQGASDTNRQRDLEVERLTVINRELRERLPRDAPERAKHEQIVATIVNRLGAPDELRADWVGPWDSSVHVDDIVAALRDLGEVYRHARAVGYAVNAALRAARDLQQATTALADAELDQLTTAVDRFVQRDRAFGTWEVAGCEPVEVQP